MLGDSVLSVSRHGAEGRDRYGDQEVRRICAGVDDGCEPPRPSLQRFALLVLILRQVKVAGDAGRLARPPRRLRDAQRRQAGANDAAQIVVGPVRQRDSVMILVATPGRVVLKRPDSPVNSRDRLRSCKAAGRRDGSGGNKRDL